MVVDIRQLPLRLQESLLEGFQEQGVATVGVSTERCHDSLLDFNSLQQTQVLTDTDGLLELDGVRS